MKTCSTCNVEKPLNEFSPRSDRPGRFKSACKSCRNIENINYRDKNRDQINAKGRERNKTQKEARHRARKKWAQKNPDKCYQYVKNNRANQKSIYGGFTGRKRYRIWESDRGICQICLEPIDFQLAWPDPKSFSIDHIVARSKGGTNEKDNLQASHLICNIMKGAD